ncbi:unnamed protein product, partial [Didymodactylos carnosus]
MKSSVYINTIEDCPVEIWREIFDYLLSTEIIQSFSQLNFRINSVIEQVQMHIDLSSLKITTTMFKYFSQNVVRPHCNQFISIQLSNENKVDAIRLFQSVCQLKHFINLRKLILIRPTKNDLIHLVHNFPSQLSTLKISSGIHRSYTYEETIANKNDDVIRTILKLKSLRTIQIPMINVEDFMYLPSSFIEHLTLDRCDKNIFHFLPVTLKYLKINLLYNSLTQLDLTASLNLPNLTHLILQTELDVQEDIENLIKVIGKNLLCLSLD